MKHNVQLSSLELLTEHLGKIKSLSSARKSMILAEVSKSGAYLGSDGTLYLKEGLLSPLQGYEIQNAVAEFLQEKFVQGAKAEQKCYTTETACRILKVSPKTLYNYRKSGLIGYVRPEGKRRILYTQEHIDSFIQKNQRYEWKK